MTEQTVQTITPLQERAVRRCSSDPAFFARVQDKATAIDADLGGSIHWHEALQQAMTALQKSDEAVLDDSRIDRGAMKLAEMLGLPWEDCTPSYRDTLKAAVRAVLAGVNEQL